MDATEWIPTKENDSIKKAKSKNKQFMRARWSIPELNELDLHIQTVP